MEASGIMSSGSGRNVVAQMALHAAIAGVFFFVLQRYGNGASIEMSLAWAGFFAAAAALLAWKQTAR